MHSKNIAPQLRTNLDTRSEDYQKNKAMMLEKLDFIDDLLDQAELGGGAYHHERLAKRGKMPIRERIMNVIDDDSPFLEISPFAGYGTDYTVGGGCVSGIGMVSGVECVIFGNDPSVKAGAMTVYVGEKWKRAKEIARLVLHDRIIIDVTEGATHYHANYVKPAWARTKTRTTRIEKHIFYRWEK